jgi:5-methylcytosine-specific restriction endonuclease McrA
LELLEVLFEQDLKEVIVKNDVKVKEKNSRYIPVKVKAKTIARAQFQCEYVGASGKRCCEKRHLQFDHQIPFAKGGKNGELNIRLYCRNHNQLTAMEVFGQRSQGRTYNTQANSVNQNRNKYDDSNDIPL